jgi:DNA modification methylase
LRSEIIWHKPSARPESVEDRPTRSHEQIFLLSKKATYFYDHEAIKEPIAESTRNDSRLNREGYEAGRPERGFPGQASHGGGLLVAKQDPETRNKRSVWTVTSRPYKEAHFATYPPELIKPCILAGCPAGGVVLDPFAGSGTTGAVALGLGRSAILIELNPDYVKLIEKRCRVNLPLMFEEVTK